MAAAAQPTSHLLACDMVPGHSADDPLYLPLIRRVRQQLRRHGLLYVGDCKMSALATRAELVHEKDYDLMPLPRTGDNADQIEDWIEEAVLGKRTLRNLTRPNEKGKKMVFARAYERERPQSSQVADHEVTWTDRVQVIRSLPLAERQAQQLDERLAEATTALHALTPPVGRGHKQYREEKALRAAVAAIEERYRVAGLLTVTWQREEEQRTRYRGSGRGGPGRPTYTTSKVRYGITKVQPNKAAIERTKARQGWRVQVTNLPVSRWNLRQAVLLYNGGWSVERDFHLLKDQPLGIQPLFVREEEQIVGLTRLLTLALRVLTFSELQVRSGLAKAKEALSGLYEGQPKRTTEHPTAGRCLKAISRMEITATRVEAGKDAQWHVTDLPPLRKRILKLLQLSPTLYTHLTRAAA
jgi:transposase